jgi:hypothetical protein
VISPAAGILSDRASRSLLASKCGNELGSVPAIGFGRIPIGSIDPDQGRPSHRRCREIPERIVVGALALSAPGSEAACFLCSEVAIGLPLPRSAELNMFLDIETKWYIGRIHLERLQPKRREVLRLIDFD